jgi:hypothetical protein
VPRLLLTAVVLAVLAAAAVLLLRAASNDAEDGDAAPAAEGCGATLSYDGRDYAGVPPEAASRFTTGEALGSGEHPLGCDPEDEEFEPVQVLALAGVDRTEAVAGAIAIDGTPTLHVWIRGPRCARSPSFDDLAACLRTPGAGAQPASTAG